ncbi:hypothetical protein PFISCL1PPCAC_16579 [Pristionchus fissidentatus]|uniref:F-box domain-containing protein n=1 Tax=Pristionchus fissidentatus TaxID=1538716 RepID=A0AAV5W0B9_9BILA|nr:hypothetical protein PFISCL1PPCAC_16579 [Pristionchus fissidentatus]
MALLALQSPPSEGPSTITASALSTETTPPMFQRTPSITDVTASDTKPRSSTPQFIARVANSMLFELNKSQIKARIKLGLLPRGMTPSPNTPLLTVDESPDVEMRETPRGTSGGPPSLTSSRRSSRATLKAIDLHDYVSSVLVSSPSSPSLLIKHSGRHSSSTPNLHSLLAASAAITTATRLAKGVATIAMSMTKLPERALITILSHLEGDDVYRMSMTCSQIRKIAIDNADGLSHRTVHSREVQINVDRNRADRLIFSVLRVPRSMRDGLPRESANLDALLPPLVMVEAKLSFGSDVSVGALRPLLRRLFDDRRLAPTAFHFTGGANTKGNKACGADLRQFTTESFLLFCAHFKPTLKEIQLATTRHFRLSPRLLSLVHVVEQFGCVYERPALRVQLTHLESVIEVWRSDSSAHSCTLHMRRPLADADEIEEQLENVEIETEERNGEVMMSSLTVPHGELHQVELHFVFH